MSPIDPPSDWLTRAAWGLPPFGVRTGVQPGDLVVLTWIDSKTYDGWQHYHGADVARCRSIGWVAETDEQRIALIQTREDVDDETVVNGVIAIPWGCVTKTEILRRAETVADASPVAEAA